MTASHQKAILELSTTQTTLIGAGTMGRAIASRILGARVISAGRLCLTVRTESVADVLSHSFGVACSTDNAAACKPAGIVLLCVKPKDVLPLLEALVAQGALAHRPLIISIAAGVRIASIEKIVGNNVPVIRAMPNTPCVIGNGTTVVAGGSTATARHLAVARQMFATLGQCIELDERHLDAVTSVSASGPAFIYLVIEALADGGVMCGLPRSVATELVAQMTRGAAEMVLTTGKHPSALKDDVTTPAGCTIAGLLTLEDGRVRSVFARAVEVAAYAAAGLAQ